MRSGLTFLSLPRIKTQETVFISTHIFENNMQTALTSKRAQTWYVGMGTSARPVLITKGDYLRFNILLSAEQVQCVEGLCYTEADLRCLVLLYSWISRKHIFGYLRCSAFFRSLYQLTDVTKYG